MSSYINFVFKNLPAIEENETDYGLRVSFIASKVRTKLGWWRGFPYKTSQRGEVRSVTIHRGETYRDTFKFRLKASARRRYMFWASYWSSFDLTWIRQAVYVPRDFNGFIRSDTVEIDLREYFP